MKLRDVAVALPSRRVSADEVAAWTGSRVDFITAKIGIESRAFLAPDETAVGLAQQACEELIGRNRALRREAVGLLIYVTQNPDFKLPHSSALLQQALGLNMATACFDVNLGCSGYVYALSIAKGLMAAEGIDDAIIVTCDPYSRIMDKADRDTVTVFGDAASATWLSTEAGGEIGAADFGTDGSGAEYLMVRAGGSAYPLTGLWTDGARYPPEDLRLRMNGRAIFNFMIRRVPESVERCLQKNKTGLREVDWFVFHQASQFLIETLRDRMGLPPERVPCRVREVGNTVSSSIPLVLAELKREKTLAGRTVLVSGFGVGLSWATNVIRFGGEG